MANLLSHPLLTTFAHGEAVTADDPFGFACRGCGHLCCTRQGLGIQRWGNLFLGGSTGLPVLSLRFDHPGNRCVFSRTVRVRGRTVGALCTIRDARPGPCRIYPLGRAFIYNPAGGEAETEYRLVHRCPGFDPNSREGVPELKRPAPEGQTVSSWLAGQLQPDLEAEKQFYLERVIPAFMERGLHAPTEDSPSGRLPERLALPLLGPLFYPMLRPPEDLISDHATVMKWLQTLTIAAGALTEQLTQCLKTGVPPVRRDSASRFDDEHSDH
jgi:Fe-S-cluster containining protein